MRGSGRSPVPDGFTPIAGKDLITNIDEGLDFLGWRIRRHCKRGTDRYYVYTYPAKKALRAIAAKVKAACRKMDTNQSLDTLLIHLNRILRGKHRRIGWKRLRRCYFYFRHSWWPTTSSRKLFNPSEVHTTRYRYRGAAIPSPWPTTAE